MKYIIIMVIALAASISNSYAAGDLARQEPVTVNLTMSDYKFEPNDLVFETGKLYRLIIKNTSEQKHEIDSASISHLAYTRKIQALDDKGMLILEVKGTPTEIEVGPGHQVEWWFVPISVTDGPEEFVCLLAGHYEAGMHGTMTFK
jgi:uncharacterized cupredoxin-like copper-binding protein